MSLIFSDFYYNATYRDVDKDKELTISFFCARPGHALHIWKRHGDL